MEQEADHYKYIEQKPNISKIMAEGDGRGYLVDGWLTNLLLLLPTYIAIPLPLAIGKTSPCYLYC